MEEVAAVAEDLAEDSDEDMEAPMAIVIVVVRPLIVSVMTSSVAVVSLPLTDSVVVIIDILECGQLVVKSQGR